MAKITREQVEAIVHNLEEAELEGIDLSGANLSRADLYKANLTRANLSQANLRSTTLTWAKLFRADLQDTSLDREVKENSGNFEYVFFGCVKNKFANQIETIEINCFKV